MEIQDFISDGPVGGQFNINLYYEPDTIYGVPALVSAPGLTLAVDLGDNVVVRGMLEFKDVLYIIAGDSLYVWVGAGAASKVSDGTMDTSTGAVWMSANANNQIAIVDRSTAKIFLWNVTNTTTGAGTWAEYTSVSSITPSSITYQDTFFVMGDADSRAIYCSGIDNGTSWATTDVSTKMGSPDNVQAVMSEGLNLWVFGKKSTEIWYYTGAASGLPFTRVGGGLLNVGCWAPNSVALVADAMFWLNERGEVCKSEGHAYQVVSPPQLNDEIQGYAQRSGEAVVEDAIGFGVIWEGHPWYILQLPSVGKTFCYDMAAAAAGQQGWFRLTTGAVTGDLSASCSAHLNGTWYLGDSNATGYIWEFNDDYYSDDGEPRYYRKYSSYKARDGHRLIFDEFSLRVYQTFSATLGASSTTLAGPAAEGATSIDVMSISGITDGGAVYIELDEVHETHGQYFAVRVDGIPAGTSVPLAEALPGAAAQTNTVYYYDEYVLFPEMSLTVTGGYTDTKTDIVRPPSFVRNFPVKWHSLGSGYDTVFQVTYTGIGLLMLLGASMRVRECAR